MFVLVLAKISLSLILQAHFLEEFLMNFVLANLKVCSVSSTFW